VNTTQLALVLDAMREQGIDVLVLGREANARAVVGTKRLWLAGTRAFAPGCVVIRATEQVHVLANSDDAVPAGFPTRCLYGITWNPEKLLASLTAIEGFTDAHVVGVDGMTPGMHALITGALPNVLFVDAGSVLERLWTQPTTERVNGVGAAAALATTGLAAMAAALRPDVWPRTLRGACAHAFAAAGVTTPAFEGVATPLDANLSTWMAPERMLDEGELVVLRAGVLRDGWEASVARTYEVQQPAPVVQPPPALLATLIERCRPGTTVGELRRLGGIVYGLGRGVEPWADGFELFAGATCAIEVHESRNLRQDVVHVTNEGHELLT